MTPPSDPTPDRPAGATAAPAPSVTLDKPVAPADAPAPDPAARAQTDATDAPDAMDAPDAPVRPASIRAFGWRDWLAVFKGLGREMGDNELTLIAAGVAFYGFLAIFPMLAALVAFYGFVLEPSTIQAQLAVLQEVAPPGAYSILEGQVASITSAGRTQLGYTSLLGLALTLWTAKAGVGALIRGLNIVFKVPAKRGFITGMAAAYGLTVLLVLVMVLALIGVVLVPGMLAAIPAVTGIEVSMLTEIAIQLARWPILLGALILAIGVLYRYGPAEPRPHFSWFSPGAVLAIVLWVAGSAAFSYYVRNFGTYNETYGSLGAIVGLLMWFYLSAVIILIGGELNAQIEFRLFGEPHERDPAFRKSWRKLTRLNRRAAAAGAAEGGGEAAAGTTGQETPSPASGGTASGGSAPLGSAPVGSAPVGSARVGSDMGAVGVGTAGVGAAGVGTAGSSTAGAGAAGAGAAGVGAAVSGVP
ncbi:MAG: YihY/virulence factor BrkB family protein [Pseudomonadota bacterium]